MSLEDSYKLPLSEIYNEWPQNTKDAADRDAKLIWLLFGLWCVFVLISLSGRLPYLK